MGGMPRGQRPPVGFRLPRSCRIRRAGDIRALFSAGSRKRTSHLDVFFLSSEGSGPRVGLVVPKHGRNVVDRNLLKRRIREVLRRDVLPRLRAAEKPLDLLVRTRREAYRTSFRQLREELTRAIEELCSGPSS